MAGSSSYDKLWEKSAKQEFSKQCRLCKSNADLEGLFYDVCHKVIAGQLKGDLLIPALAEVIAVNEDAPNLLADVLQLCGKFEQRVIMRKIKFNMFNQPKYFEQMYIMFEKMASPYQEQYTETQAVENREQRDLCIWLIGNCSNRVLSDWILKERLDYDTTGDAGIIQNKKFASTKFIKLKTRLYYKQQKYNLCREESEGYAKLITELCQDDGFELDYMLQIIKSLIGCFNLDPNRVLDMILECFECRLDKQEIYIPLLKRFLENSSTLSQILAFKLIFYQNDINTVTPSSLYDVIANCLSHELVDLNDIYPYISPSDSKILEYFKHELQEAKTVARKVNVIATGDSKPVVEEKVGLISALLKAGDWVNAKELIYKLPEFHAVSNKTIAKQLCVLIHYSVDKLYKTHSGLHSFLAKKIKPYKCENLPQVKQVENSEEFQKISMPMIVTLGPYLHQDPLLLNKIIRICKTLLINGSDSVKYDVHTIVDDAILPSMSLVGSNCSLSDELWALFKVLPYQSRFKLYTSWKSEPTNSLMIKTRATTMKRIKYIMKRLSKENVKLSGRQIGKLSHSNPSFLFDYILSQIQSYDNLIGPVVDSMKYLTSLSYDVLSFCIIEALASPGKERTKHDGATISPWLISLANFCGTAVKKYSIELPGLLQFVANQLKAEKSLDLLVLKDIVQKMTGIETMEEMTDEQISALCGGELLRVEGGYFNQVRNTKKAINRLKDALLEQNLAMPLCILMAQQRNCILYQEQDHSHLKLVGKLYDQCQETLVQYGSCLASSLGIHDYSGQMPSLEKLLMDFNLNADVAFFLIRPMVAEDIQTKYDEIKKAEKSSTKSILQFVEASEMVVKPLVDSIIPALPTKFWDDLSPRFFVTFWTLSMYDLHVPTSSYEREVDKFKQQIQASDDNKDLNANKKKKEKERCLGMMERLQEEENKQQEHCKKVHARLQKEKDQWFKSKLAKMEMTTQFLQHCLFPRCKFTASDALYCAKFVHLLHTLQTPNFSTLICYDRIFEDISYTMCFCTENEANHYGRFLSALLETVMKWHKDKTIFEKECARYPGFVTKFCDKDPVHVDYENYRHVCHKWHYRLTKAFILCLDSSDYVQIRNSLIILTKVLPYFPVMISFAQAIEKRVENIRNEEKDKRPDLYALATGPESEFHLKDGKKQGQPTPATANNNPNNKVVKIVKQEVAPVKKEIKVEPGLIPSNLVKTNSSSAKDKEKKESKPKTNDIEKSDKKESKSRRDEKKGEKNGESFKADSRSSSVTNSPRRTEGHRSRSQDPDERDHKRRKIEKNHDDNRDDHKRAKESTNSPNDRTHEKKTSRKREADEVASESKRRKNDEGVSKSKRHTEERDKKSASDPHKSSSRRMKDK